MKLLILINGAPYHRPFYARVADVLVRDGHDVHFAVDSHWTDFTSPRTPLPTDRTTYFSDFFERHYDRCPLSAEFSDLNLWTALFPDLDRAEYSTTFFRRRPGYYERLLENLVAYFSSLFDQHHFDAIVYETVSNAFSYVAFLVGERRGVRYIGIGSSRLPGHIDVTDGKHFRHSRTERLYRDILEGRATPPPAVRERARDYKARRATAKRADYVVANTFMTWNPLRRYARATSLTTFLEACRFYLSSPRRHEYAYQLSNPLVAYPEQFARETVRFMRTRLLRARHVVHPDLSKRFFLYPLQYHPESSSAVDSTYFNDELTNIINVSLNLPPGHLLYVKDHPYAFALAPSRLYRRLRRLPNVRFVDWNFDGTRLLESAAAVVTSSSSMGFEAILLGKPVYVLGHPFYDFHPLVRRVRAWDEAFSQFADHAHIRAADGEIDALLEAYFWSSRPGSYDLQSSLESPEAIATIARVIIEEASSHAAAPRRTAGTQRSETV